MSKIQQTQNYSHPLIPFKHGNSKKPLPSQKRRTNYLCQWNKVRIIPIMWYPLFKTRFTFYSNKSHLLKMILCNIFCLNNKLQQFNLYQYGQLKFFCLRSELQAVIALETTVMNICNKLTIKLYIVSQNILTVIAFFSSR